LLFSGTQWKHGRQVPKSARVLDPEGNIFEGTVNQFIGEFTAEKFAEITLFDPDALHFSPTVVRNWSEPPDFKPTFKGTWLAFIAKYPGATAIQKTQGEGKQKKRLLWICVPQKGKFVYHKT
jgi:hypothetical protein